MIHTQTATAQPTATARPRPAIPIHTDYDARPLMRAVVIVALRDARQRRDTDKRNEARQWLVNDGLAWLDACDIYVTPCRMRRWLDAGAKLPQNAALRPRTRRERKTA